MFKIFSQRDKRWATVTLGQTKHTIGRLGCTITSIAAALTSFGKATDPAKLAKTLSFTREGLLLWGSLAKVGCRLDQRFYGHNQRLIQGALAHPKKFALIQVDSSHWVLATGNYSAGVYKIADPWFGDRSTTKRYGKITGGAVITVL